MAECSRRLDPALGGADDLIGRTEDDVASELRLLGATFVDLLNERQTMGVRRGYRSVDTSVPYSGPRRGMGIKDEKPRVLPKRPAKPKATPAPDPRNRIVESIRDLKDFDPTAPAPERGDVPF